MEAIFDLVKVVVRSFYDERCIVLTDFLLNDRVYCTGYGSRG